MLQRKMMRYLHPQIDTRGLVGHWKLYEHTYFDYSLNGNDGTAADTDEEADRGIGFDGADSIVTVGADPSIDANGKTVLSISAWINPASDGENDGGRIVDKYNVGATLGYRLLTLSESAGNVKLHWEMEHATTDMYVTSLGATVPLNIWSHIVATYNEDSDGKGKLFLNGAAMTKDNDQAADVIGAPSDDSAVDLTIGNNAALDRTFDGSISDVQIYSKALSAAEVLSIYSVTRGRYSV